MWIVFWAFRIMVGIGMLMIGCALVGLLLRRGGRYWQQPVFLNVLRLMAFTPLSLCSAAGLLPRSAVSPGWSTGR